MKLSEVEIDSQRQEDGDWVDDIPELGDLRVKVRGFNRDFKRLQGRLIQSLPREQRISGRVDPIALEKIIGRCLVETVLLDWDNLYDGDTKVPYSKHMAAKLLNEPQYARFRAGVEWAASIVAERKAEDIEADAKN